MLLQVLDVLVGVFQHLDEFVLGGAVGLVLDHVRQLVHVGLVVGKGLAGGVDVLRDLLEAQLQVVLFASLGLSGLDHLDGVLS